ncbi:cuticle protein 10.9-like [Varroa jacobsoni]|uniref:Cuticle protein n=1 Tax=Varroa destructor TaxID=109461 RepID=A0A7M7M3M3_VARDE|nr:adult-specific rigid cuticular protein 15.5-like [Varroa destructor]XP_022695617.1 cuticle protein 10.9-like [Varroa jacobsoni]
MKCFTVFVVVAVAAAAAQHTEEKYGPPEPYAYSYATEDAEGSSSAEQSTDASGRVTGKYTISLADGRTRTVTYWADETGFHADVVTNELGTESKNPADVTIQSSAPTGPEAALAAEPQRVKAKASYAAPIYAPAPAAYAAPVAYTAPEPVHYAPVHARYYKRRA